MLELIISSDRIDWRGNDVSNIPESTIDCYGRAAKHVKELYEEKSK
jgi:hypothetical protein